MLKHAAAATATLAVAVLGSFGAAGPPSASAAEQGAADGRDRAPLVRAERAVAGQYIVVLRSTTGDERGEAREAVAGDGGSVRHVYGALGGFAAQLTDRQLAEVREDPDVSFVQQDARVTVSTTQSGATWGLDRIDQRSRPLSGTFTYTRTGSGVRAYVIDTGIQSHSEFTGRLAAGYTVINDRRGTSDCNGHGTHVAGTVGGTRYGVAKQVTLVPVRVLNCRGSGTSSGVISGMDWVASRGVRPAVANMSLGGSADSATDAAIARMTDAGVTVAVAAGNENQNACNVSPARAPSAITVGATTSSDARSSFSNYGSCVDIFAPGSSITSAWIGSTTATNTISGTSMASPHVAGVAALYLQGNPSASPATVTNALLSNATTNVVSGVNGSPNRLLFTAY